MVAKSGQQSSSTSIKLESNDPKTGGGPSSSSSIDSKMLQSNSPKKLTIETNRACVNLVELFPEFSGSYSSANGNILAAQFYGHAHVNVSIQAAKSGSNRYRLQTDAPTYDYLCLLMREFVQRLEAHFQKQSQPIEMSFAADQLPTDELKVCIDKHLELRHTLETYKEAIEKCCVQFRAIQKRLLIKFKVNFFVKNQLKMFVELFDD
jgi:hypothetical protein